MTVVISKKDDSTLNAKIFFKVKEVAPNNTCLQGDIDVTIPVNREIRSIDINPDSFTYVTTIKDRHHEWYSLGAPCGWIKNLQVKIDADASDDSKHIGVKGTFAVPITVR